MGDLTGEALGAPTGAPLDDGGTGGAPAGGDAVGCARCRARWAREAGADTASSGQPPAASEGADAPLAAEGDASDGIARSRSCLRRRDGPRAFTLCDIARQNAAGRCWLTAHGVVYDVTDFLPAHPGGAKSLLRRAASNADASQDYDFHSRGARALWGRYEVGARVSCARAAGEGPSCSVQ